jgi:hypothetical protein
MVRARRVAEVFTADGLSDRWHALRLGARMLREEVSQGQAESEAELRERFGLGPPGTPQLTSMGGRGPEAQRTRRLPRGEDGEK